MDTSTSPNHRFQRSFVPTTALAKRVDFDDRTLQVTFTDGRVLSVPLSWFPLLADVTPEQRANLHWPDIDKDLSIAGLMGGVDRNAG